MGMVKLSFWVRFWYYAALSIDVVRRAAAMTDITPVPKERLDPRLIEFRRIDADADDTLSFGEFLLADRPYVEEQSRIFHRMDADSNGRISRDEFNQLFRKFRIDAEVDEEEEEEKLMMDHYHRPPSRRHRNRGDTNSSSEDDMGEEIRRQHDNFFKKFAVGLEDAHRRQLMHRNDHRFRPHVFEAPFPGHTTPRYRPGSGGDDDDYVDGGGRPPAVGPLLSRPQAPSHAPTEPAQQQK